MIVIKSPKSLSDAIKKYDLAMSEFYIDLGKDVNERNKPAFNAKTPILAYFMRSTSGKTLTRHPSSRTIRNYRAATMTMGDLSKVSGIKFHGMMPERQREQFRYMKMLAKTPGSSFYNPWRNR